MFTITGLFQGRVATITYNISYNKKLEKGGTLTGDQSVIDKAKFENTQAHGYLGPIPADVNKDYLFHELPAHALLTNFVFESIISEENDWEPYDPDLVY